MSGAEVKDAVTVEEAPFPARPALPPPADSAPAYAAPATSFVDRALLWVEQRPLLAALAIFIVLLAVHLIVLNATGVANGIFIGDAFFGSVGSNPIEILLLAFVAYNVVLPTLVAHACIKAFDDIRSSLALDDRGFGHVRASLVDPFVLQRLVLGGSWAVVLTPVFGGILSATIAGEERGYALLTFWMYVRIALTFGFLGSSITFVAMLHHRLRKATAAYLRIDLFEMAPLAPLVRYARRLALYLIVLLAFAGPAIAQPEAMVASSALLAFGVILAGVAVIGAMWGTRRAIRAAKKTATQELERYSRELWRRAYTNGHIAEAVAIPALGAMLTVRNEIARIGDWPGGWSVFARFAVLIALPVMSWFGGQLAAYVTAMLAR